MSEDYLADRHNGLGTHHDRHLTNTEILWMGVGLWRTLSWIKENQRRLTPQEQAEYEMAVERWKAYLFWEEMNPGAREARENIIEREQIAAHNEHMEGQHRWNRRYVWRPITIFPFLQWGADRGWADYGYTEVADYGYPAGPFWAEVAAGVGLWLLVWAVCIRVKRFCIWFKRTWKKSWHRAQTERLAREAAEREAERARPSDTLPVLWSPYA